MSKVGECEVFNYYTRRCDKCKLGYFLNAGVCYKGFIPNCAEFESINKCMYFFICVLQLFSLVSKSRLKVHE